MGFYRALLRNHVLANLVFILVLVVGGLSYLDLPRQQDPSINFNWIVITTVLPGASAGDVEKKVTDPLEDALRQVQDVKFMSSNSRETVSTILVRFDDIDARTFDKRISDLRREIQNKEDELPDAAEDSRILEITSANGFPSATIAVVGQGMDENLRRQARNVRKDLERLQGVDRVDATGLVDPELQVRFFPELLEELRLTPGQIADTVSAFFQDIAAGDAQVGRQNWLVRLVGSSADPGHLASRTLVGADIQASEWKYVPVRRIALYIEESLYHGTQWVVFEPNDEPLWAQVRLNIGAFMQDLFSQGAFQGSSPREAYFVKCDAETNPPEVREAGQVVTEIGLAPARPGEFVVVRLIHGASGVAVAGPTRPE